MANPVLSDKTFRDLVEPKGAGVTTAPAAMTLQGTINAAATLFALLLASSVIGWRTVKVSEGEVTSFPGWILAGVLVGFGLCLVNARKPSLARITGPIYAVIEGLVVGAISHVYNVRFDGIVVQAVFATIATFGMMLFLYQSKILRVTDRFRRVVVGATLGLMALYGVSLLLALFGVRTPVIHDATPLGILFSVGACVLAALNLAIDFDVIERGIKARAPRYMEWYAGFALLVTVVWLYLELLRLLGKLQRR